MYVSLLHQAFVICVNGKLNHLMFVILAIQFSFCFVFKCIGLHIERKSNDVATSRPKTSNFSQTITIEEEKSRKNFPRLKVDNCFFTLTAFPSLCSVRSLDFATKLFVCENSISAVRKNTFETSFTSLILTLIARARNKKPLKSFSLYSISHLVEN